MDKTYIPNPIDTSDVTLSPELVKLANLLSANVHNVWAVGRIQEGWTYGPARDDARKETPCIYTIPTKNRSNAYDRYRTIDDNSARAASLYFGYCRPV